MPTYWLWLDGKKNISPTQRNALLERFSGPEGIFQASARALSRVEGLGSEAAQALLDKDLTAAQGLEKLCAAQDIGILTPDSPEYPRWLKNISDFPNVLYYRGTWPDLESRPAIGVVGTRKASPYGINVATQMGWQVSRCGGIVVSGMATGIDSAATQGALASGRITVGVLGCGVDLVYPKGNRELYEQMLEKGCLVSEYAPGTPAYRWNFPRRNRIISGLSRGVLVVEAPVQSGAMITARQALEQGRDVFVVPGNINVASCEGSNSLLRDGAMMASSGWDVVSTYEGDYPGMLKKDMSTLQSEPRPVQVAQTVALPKTDADKKPVDIPAKRAYSVPEGELSANEQAILAQIPGQEANLDDIIAETGLSAGAVMAGLTSLKIKGYVSAMQGRRVLRT